MFLSVVEINKKQSLWKATKYTLFDHMTKAEVTRMAGGRRSARAFPATKPVAQKDLQRKTSPPGGGGGVL